MVDPERPDREPGTGSTERREATVGNVLTGVVFESRERRSRRRGKATTEFFVSGTPEHKILLPDPDYNFEPTPGVPYDVQVTIDTKPGERKGKLFVKPLKEEGVPMAVEKKRETPLPIEINKAEGVVYVLDTEIPYNPDGGPMVPSMKKFEHFTLDEHTLKTLHKIATAVDLKKPLLLEGETGVAKTSPIEYLAAITNHELLRLNFSGQTDTSELIGKFVPNDGQVQLEFEKLLMHVENLSAKSQAIINTAAGEQRELSLTESQMVASEEGIQVPEWRWQDGMLPRAMKTGAWLLCDELMLSEASVRERMNSALERKPWLVLSENKGESVGEGADHEMHPDFRVFGASNPSSYAGREPLTPAEKRRWTGYLFVERPDEKSYEAMMNFAAFGTQPKVNIDGQEYQGDDADPTYKLLKRIPRFKEMIIALSKFHAQIEKMAHDKTIGKGRPEPYVFTRDNLLALMDFLDAKRLRNAKTKKQTTAQSDPKTVMQRAFKECYLDFMQGDDDKKKMTDQFKAVGLHDENWLFS